MQSISRAIMPSCDATATAEVLSGAWPGYKHEHALKWVKRLPKAEWKNNRVLEDDGRVVAYLRVVPLRIRVGAAVLRVGGIAGVSTDPRARRKGYASALMNDTNEFMRSEGYDLALLYGIPSFYHRFGYEVVAARYFVTIPQTEIPESRTKYARTAVSKRDLPRLLPLYNGQTTCGAGNVVRSRMPEGKQGFKITDGRGRVAGYALWSSQDGSLSVLEAVARDADAARGLMRHIRRVAMNHGLSQVTVLMPFRYPLTEAIRPYNCTLTRVNSYRRNCMGRVLNLGALARRMRPEWRRLLGGSEFAGGKGRLSVQVDGENLTVRFSGGRVLTEVGAGAAGAKMPQEKFSQLLFGYAPVESLAAGGEIAVPKRDLRLLEVLFPERTSFLFAPDEF